MNKLLWLFLILVTSILFIASFFTREMSLAVIALILAVILDKNNPFNDKRNKEKEFLKGIEKGRKFKNE